MVKLAKMPDGTPEIYGPVLQGEGTTQGTPSVFVRFTGCNLYCTWCVVPETKITTSSFNKVNAGDLNIGDKLHTHKGETEVVKLSRKKVGRYVKITLENGKTLKCSVDHPLINSKNEEITASKLSIGDELKIFT